MYVKFVDDFLKNGILLVVFFPEICLIAPCDIKKFCYYGRNASEVSGAGFSAKNIPDLPDIYVSRISLRIHYIVIRKENRIRSDRFKFLKVAFEISGISGQILFWSELDRINIYRKDQTVTFIPCFSSKRKVTFMERSHCRNKTYSSVYKVVEIRKIPHFCYISQYFRHNSDPFSKILFRRGMNLFLHHLNIRLPRL